MSDCVFCRIVVGEIPATVVAENDGAFAFNDLGAKSPTHVLVVPRTHHGDVTSLAGDPDSTVAVITLAATVAEITGVAESGWRLVFNNGPDSRQEVFHVHGHVMGGRRLGALG
ncbi:MAG: hypothetical protein JWM93_1039 [Frankiales bacterium]|nr:hypothetical protein [Frankiales bacterium]